MTTAGLAALGALAVARGSAAGAAFLIAAALVLLWSDVRVLLVGLRDPQALGRTRDMRGYLRALRLPVAALVTYPVGSLATCAAVAGGWLLLPFADPHPLPVLVAGSLLGGAALRAGIGAAAVAFSLRRLPPRSRDALRGALHFG